MIDLNKLAHKCHESAAARGFWEEDKPLGVSLMLIVTELAEILEHDRHGTLNEPSSKVPNCSNFEEEMADVLIRLLDLAGAELLDIDTAVRDKLEANEKRGYRHGKEY